jgi:predicted RNA-binding protein with PUA-like domain
MAIKAVLKTEPSGYSFDDLEREGKTVWGGISNYAALRNLEALKIGDPVAIYHTGSERAAVGLAIVARAAYRPLTERNPKFLAIDLKAGRRFRTPVPLEDVKREPEFAESPLVTNGRLSVVLLTSAQGIKLDRLSQRPAAS